MKQKCHAIAFLVALIIGARALAQGYSPEEALKRMTLPDGLRAQLVASETMISQPVCIEFDDRGRLWVLQYLQYPNPAELNRVKVDRYSRTVYDKIPEPPPRGPKGSDRITILYDFDENARARKSTDFVTGLNLACGIAFGHGGVFVLQVPYLLFYPDKNRDDVPDSDPEVLLTGFGMEDAHSVANSLTWGPDGWLYGCQGSTVTAKIRGIEFQQGIWRYHPPTKRFELFCEGGGNSWGLDFDEDGELIYSTNLSPFRNLHGVQGGYYWKSFGKHGALHNPYTYGYFDHIPYENFTGGHVCDGGIIYQGTNMPAKYRGKYIANDLLNHAVQWHHMERWGSTFKAGYGGELMTSHDTWFAPSDLTMGPDDAIYIADWHDKRTAHPDPDAEWDRRNGRVYRISAAGASPTSPQSLAEEVFGRSVTLSSEKLIKLLGDKNNWLVRKARRILADRRDPSVFPKLRGEVFAAKDEHLALENLWALYVSGGADESFLNDCLDHPSSKIRSWAVRFLGDQEKISPTSAEHLVKLSSKEADVRVRRQFASTAKRLPAKHGCSVAFNIARRDLDAQDAFIPLLLWWAVEKHSVEATSGILELFAAPDATNSSIIRETILPRLMRRYAAEGTKKTLSACGHLLKVAPESRRSTMLTSLEQGLREQTDTKLKFNEWPANLREQLLPSWNDGTKDQMMIRLLARAGFEPAQKRALTLARDAAATAELRVAMLQLAAGLPGVVGTNILFELSGLSQPEPVQLAALDAIQQIPQADISGLLANYPKMSARVRSKARDVFFSRKAWAEGFLRGVDEGRYAKDEVPLDQLQKIALLEDKQLDELVRKNWGNISGGTPEEKLADIRRFNNDLRAFSGDAKKGHAVFMKHCGVCHRMFDEGENVGPDLTHVNRDKDFLLTSIVDPSAIIRKEFINHIVETSDGQSLTGVIAEQSANSLTLIAAKSERVTVSRDKIASLRESTVSMMPEGLMHALTPQERRDLFAFLQTAKPTTAKK